MSSNLVASTTDIRQGYAGVTQAISNWVLTTDGRYMCCWLDTITGEFIMGYSIGLDFLSIDYAVESIVVALGSLTTRIAGSPTSLYKRDDGKVLLFVVNSDYDSWVKCYISASGNGDDWVFYSLVFESLVTGYRPSNMSAYVNIPIVLPSGRLVINFITGSQYMFLDNNFDDCMCAISDDNGVSWTITNFLGRSGIDGCGQICLLPDGSMFFSWVFGGGSEKLLKSIDSGVTWTQVASWDTTFANSGIHSWLMSYYYDPITTNAYAYCANFGFIAYLENPTESNFTEITTWTILAQDLAKAATSGCRIYMLNGYLIFHTTSYGKSYLYTGFPTKPILPILKSGRHAIYIKGLDQKKRIRNIKNLDTEFVRSGNLKHKVDTNTWGGTTT